MAKKNLSEDEIKYIFSADDSKLQQEIHDLTKQSKELTQTNKARLKSMIELESQGKKNTKEYKKLAKEYDATRKKIRENSQRIAEHVKLLDVNALSMSQLRKRSKELKRDLDEVSKALEPERYAELEAQLGKVNGRMAELNQKARGLKETMNTDSFWDFVAGTTVVKLIEAGVKLAKDLYNNVKALADESVEMARAADGVTRAFEQLDKPGLLDSLRRSTKGTVNDINLMKAAVQANDFRIPLEDLGKYLQFAQLKAQQTGQSVDYMTNSIVTGLGRRSVMILDNLGLSAAEINEQMAQGADFAKAVAAIVDKQLAQAGETYVSAADRAAQATVRLQNAQKELGDALLPVSESLGGAVNELHIGLVKAFTFLVKNKGVVAAISILLSGLAAATLLTNVRLKEYIVTSKAAVVVTRLWGTVAATARAATLLFSAGMATLTGNTARATAAMKLFNTTCKGNLIGAGIALVLSFASAMSTFASGTDKGTGALQEMNGELMNEQRRLTDLFDSLRKAGQGTKERVELIGQINQKYGEYLPNLLSESSNLDEIDAAYKRINDSLVQNIALKYKDQEISEATSKAAANQIKAAEGIRSSLEKKFRDNGLANEAIAELKEITSAYYSEGEGWQKAFNNAYHTISRKYFGGKSLGRIAEADMETYVSSYYKMQEDIEKINRKYENWQPVGSSSSTGGTLSDEQLKQQMEEGSLIKKLEAQKQKVQDTWVEDTWENIRLKNQELERIDAEIDKLKKLGTTVRNVARSSKSDEAEKEAKAVVRTEKAAVQSLKDLREESLQHQEELYNGMVDAENKALASGLISQEQHDMRLIMLQTENAEELLRIEREYYSDAKSMAITDADTREGIVREANKAVIAAEKEANAARAAEQQKLTSLIRDFKEQFKLTTVDEDYQAQKEALEAAFQARMELACKHHLDTAELEKAYQRASEQLEQEHQERIMEIRRQYGLTTMQEEYQAELLQLQNARDQQLLTEQQYEQAVMNLRRDSYKKQFDYYRELFGNAFEALQQSEIDAVNAKYDVLLEAAKGNTEETERLENEKAQKSLDIQKKYADVNFAVKVSQIIADTAVSIMKAYADLGPIAGSVAAALLGVTGAAQLKSAKAERDKIKNLSLGGGASSGKGTGSRVAIGREKGGKVDVRRAQDGRFFPGADYGPDRRGYIDRPTVIVGEGPKGRSKEWVASNAAVENPTVAPLLDIIDRAQQAGSIRTLDLNNAIRARLAGYSSGGGIGQEPQSPSHQTPPSVAGFSPSVMERLADAVEDLTRNGVKAPVVLSELQKKQELLNQSRSIGSKH